MTEQFTTRLVDKLYVILNVADNELIYDMHGKCYIEEDKAVKKMKFLKGTNKYKNKQLTVIYFSK